MMCVSDFCFVYSGLISTSLHPSRNTSSNKSKTYNIQYIQENFLLQTIDNFLLLSVFQERLVPQDRSNPQQFAAFLFFSGFRSLYVLWCAIFFFFFWLLLGFCDCSISLLQRFMCWWRSQSNWPDYVDFIVAVRQYLRVSQWQNYQRLLQCLVFQHEGLPTVSLVILSDTLTPCFALSCTDWVAVLASIHISFYHTDTSMGICQQSKQPQPFVKLILSCVSITVPLLLSSAMFFFFSCELA